MKKYEEKIRKQIEELTSKEVEIIKIENDMVISYIPTGYNDVFNIIDTIVIPISEDPTKYVDDEHRLDSYIKQIVFVQYKDNKSSKYCDLNLLKSVLLNAEVIYPVAIIPDNRLNRFKRYKKEIIDRLNNKRNDIIILGFSSLNEAIDIKEKLLSNSGEILSDHAIVNLNHLPIYRINKKYFSSLDNKMLEEYNKIPKEDLKYIVDDRFNIGIPLIFECKANTIIYNNIVAKDKDSDLLNRKISNKQMRALIDLNRKNIMIINGKNIYCYNLDDAFKNMMNDYSYYLDNNVLMPKSTPGTLIIDNESGEKGYIDHVNDDGDIVAIFNEFVNDNNIKQMEKIYKSSKEYRPILPYTGPKLSAKDFLDEDEIYIKGSIGVILKSGKVIKGNKINEGKCFKSLKKFEELKDDEICYVPEITGDYIPSLTKDISLIHNNIALSYTKGSFLEITNQNEKQAAILYDMVEWQDPGLLYNNLISDGEFK